MYSEMICWWILFLSCSICASRSLLSAILLSALNKHGVERKKNKNKTNQVQSDEKIKTHSSKRLCYTNAVQNEEIQVFFM